jgi:hypothetical protein
VDEVTDAETWPMQEDIVGMLRRVGRDGAPYVLCRDTDSAWMRKTSAGNPAVGIRSEHVDMDCHRILSRGDEPGFPCDEEAWLGLDRREPSGATDASTALGWCELGHPCIDIEQQEDMT